MLKYVFLFCSLSLVLFGGLPPALAGTSLLDAPHYEEAPGCRDLVYKAMKGQALASVIYEASSAEELILKPESVLRLTCFETQIKNAARSSRDRHLRLNRLANRADTKVIAWANDYLADNYGDNIIGRIVSADCRANTNLWDALTGNGIIRWNLYENGAPDNPRPDGVYNYSVEDVWHDLPIPTAWSIHNEKASVIDAVSAANIDALEQEMFEMTKDIQSDLIDPAEANYAGHNYVTGLGVNVEAVFDAIE